MSSETPQEQAQLVADAQAAGQEMGDRQVLFLGVHSVNVQADADAMANSVSVPVSELQQTQNVSNAMLKDAPNMPFDLPFHIQRFFGGRVPEEKGS